ncbi:membrane protein [Photorhabdus luminescens subsp. luminescens]|uniref:Cell division protein DamX n=1 Tax=Photorhabdus luminescens TaxID=29488 RepID=A0A1G5QCP8_PHOLU|nr:SPOR domain-containing protein [Photorhabdus luminescens]KMW72454.1 membrane protein [Photorhabdus luminescens subsp. luminescens]SCZ59467.1 DamX protein [Photorhabdus luminescens]
MDEFKSENEQRADNEFRPDTSDRRSSRSRQPLNKPKFAISRQQMMLGIGILVLLLLIIAISSALKAPTEHEKQQSPNVAEKNIDLSGSSSSNDNSQPITSESNTTNTINRPQEIHVPPVSSTATQPHQPQTNNGESQNQRIELPGNIPDALTQQQSNINHAVQNLNQAQQSQPVTPPPVVQQKPENIRPLKSETPAKSKPSTNHTSSKNNEVSSASSDLLRTPANHYTLQLSSASRSDTLTAFAKKYSLTHYKVYETKRNGKVWFVLIHGNYRSVSEAKQAVSSLPAEIQAKKPWVRTMQQVQQDLRK